MNLKLRWVYALFVGERLSCHMIRKKNKRKSNYLFDLYGRKDGYGTSLLAKFLLNI